MASGLVPITLRTVSICLSVGSNELASCVRTGFLDSYVKPGQAILLRPTHRGRHILLNLTHAQGAVIDPNFVEDTLEILGSEESIAANTQWPGRIDQRAYCGPTRDLGAIEIDPRHGSIPRDRHMRPGIGRQEAAARDDRGGAGIEPQTRQPWPRITHPCAAMQCIHVGGRGAGRVLLHQQCWILAAAGHRGKGPCLHRHAGRHIKRGRIGHRHDGRAIEGQAPAVLALGGPGRGVERGGIVIPGRIAAGDAGPLVKAVGRDEACDRPAAAGDRGHNNRIAAEIADGIARADAIAVACAGGEAAVDLAGRGGGRDEGEGGAADPLATFHLIAGHADVVGRGSPTQVDLGPADRRGG